MLRTFLYAFVLLILCQVAIGGITRLTESGLSITEWAFFSGVLPPTSHDAWLQLFQEYKNTPQYAKINSGMSLSEFKFIYFWEYFHRLFGRFVGIIAIWFVFVAYSFGHKWFRRSLGLLGLIVFVGAFGWVMVASGLKSRPWVNAYYLSTHLSLAMLALIYVLRLIVLDEKERGLRLTSSGMQQPFFLFFACVVFVQFFLGGMVSGMRAALFYPSFPLMNGKLIPSVLLDSSFWQWRSFWFYDESIFLPTLVLFIHRLFPLVIVFLSLFFFWKVHRNKGISSFWRRGAQILLFLIFVQIALGILTLINSAGQVPVSLGVFHQFVGVILLGQAVTFIYLERYLAK